MLFTISIIFLFFVAAAAARNTATHRERRIDRRAERMGYGRFFSK